MNQLISEVIEQLATNLAVASQNRLTALLPRATPRAIVQAFAVLFAIFGLLAMINQAEAQVIEMIDTGPAGSRVDIVILGDGFQAAEMQDFEDAAYEVISTLFSYEPYATYQSFFNVTRIETPSNQSGAGQNGLPIDTVFGAYFDCGNPPIEWLLCVDEIAVETVLNNNGIILTERDIVLVIVNDPEYGGSGGAYAVTSRDPDSQLIALHELGHSFGDLADEYTNNQTLCDTMNTFVSQNPGAYDPKNISQESTATSVPWSHWLTAGSGALAPDLDDPGDIDLQIGVFDGALGCAPGGGWFRSSENSMMRSNGRPLGNVNIEQILQKIYIPIYLTDEIEPSITPTNQFTAIGLPVVLNFTDPRHVVPSDPIGITFTPNFDASVLANLTFDWSIDGQQISTAPIVNIRRSDMPSMLATLSVTIVDETPRIMDPSVTLSATETFDLFTWPPPSPSVTAPATPVPAAWVNSSCSSKSTCTDGTTSGLCQGGSCVCDSDGDCGAGATTCIRRTFRPNFCAPTGLAEGETCFRDRQCASDRCRNTQNTCR